MAAAYSAAVDSAVDEGFEDPEKLLSEFTPTFPTTSTISISKKHSEEQTNNSQGEVRLPHICCISLRLDHECGS